MISLEKLSTQAPDLVKRYVVAKDQFEGLGKAAVYLVVDVSGSMHRLFKDGVVQDLGERALGLSATLDDDGIVPTMFFNTGVRETHHLVIGQHQGFMNNIARPNGGTRFTPAMRAIIDYHQSNGVDSPALVLFQTDGEQEDTTDTEKVLLSSRDLPIFWQYIGMGKTTFPYMERLARLPGGTVNNAGMIVDPCRTQDGRLVSVLSDDQLYGQISTNYARWLRDARSAGIL